MRFATGLFALAFSAAALAHPGHPADSAFFAGLTHPLLGADHLLAMLAVGIWGARYQGRARWVLPAAFVCCMLLGTLLGFAGVAMPVVEPMIAVSVLALGIIVASTARVPLAAGAAVVGAFAVFHGYAHFAEAPVGASLAIFAAGMLAATAFLHLTGFGLALRMVSLRDWLPRALGGAMALAGAWFLVA